MGFILQGNEFCSVDLFFYRYEQLNRVLGYFDSQAKICLKRSKQPENFIK